MGSRQAAARRRTRPCVATRPRRDAVASRPRRPGTAVAGDTDKGIGSDGYVNGWRSIGAVGVRRQTRTPRARLQLNQALTDCCHIELDRRGTVTGFHPRSDHCAGCDGAP